jgi:Ca2+-binding EF-hand superfamily protein
VFFPHLHHSFNLRDSEATKVESSNERRKRLEAFVKEKFTKTWVSVKKAFLDLDADHDGFITHEDLIRYFRTGEEGFLFEDLRTLLM